MPLLPDTDARLRSAADAVGFLSPLWRHTGRGPMLVVPIDDDDRPTEIVALTDASDAAVPPVLQATAQRLAGEASVRRLLLVTDRTGRRPVLAPDDELLWEGWAAMMAAQGWRLVDWLVRVDCYAFSIAEYAPTKAAW